MPKKSIYLETTDQILRSGVDRRTRSSTQKAAEKLFSNFSAREIAEELGLSSYQAAGGLRRRISRGRAFSGALRDLLNETFENLTEDPIIDNSGMRLYKREKTLARDVKTAGKRYVVASYGHMDLRSAKKWWLEVTGGAEYFVVLKKQSAKTGAELFYIMDIDPDRTRISKGGKERRTVNYRAERLKLLHANYLKQTGGS